MTAPPAPPPAPVVDLVTSLQASHLWQLRHVRLGWRHTPRLELAKHRQLLASSRMAQEALGRLNGMLFNYVGALQRDASPQPLKQEPLVVPAKAYDAQVSYRGGQTWGLYIAVMAVAAGGAVGLTAPLLRRCAELALLRCFWCSPAAYVRPGRNAVGHAALPRALLAVLERLAAMPHSSRACPRC